jgi:crotonobetainyl-CoA:carnitine CoA-transferase CaiB-like acyl-CoA transferase
MGVLDGLEVLDLSWGISGPMTTMLLADHGARVTRIEPPDGDPWSGLSGYQVWQRGKRSAVLDLKAGSDRRRFLALAARADVVVESFAPGVTARLGIDYDTLSALNPRLVHCSITGYGPDGPDAHRPGIDALVAARTGQQWEARGPVGGTLGRLSGSEGMMPGLEAPPGCWVGPDREGPLFSGVPWVSLATFYIATIGVNAALRAREITGRGQHVNASLLHGVLATTVGAWIEAEHVDTPYFQTWVFDPRAPKAFFETSDGRWSHHWTPLPEFVLTAAAHGLRWNDEVRSPRDASMRINTAPEDMVLLHAYQDQMAEAIARFPAQEWVDFAAQVGVPVQTVRSPEEALADPALLADGCVTEVDDPRLGPIRQVGRVIDMPRHPQRTPTSPPTPGQHTAEVLAEADELIRLGLGDTAPLAGDTAPLAGDTAPLAADAPEPEPGRRLGSPLEGITVLDLGLAVAGPFGTQVLAQLGARVIKVSTMHDEFWLTTHIGMCCNRDKDSIALNLKDPEAMSVLRRLVERADVVQHNMRYDAAERLGIDYESLRRINPTLIYCHTIGHDQGPRQAHVGNDQTGAALAGTTWLDGGLDAGGRPIWSNTSIGDTGNGFLSALGIVQALRDRDRTGEGQFLRTSILYAHLLNTSTAWLSADGTRTGDRQRPDAEQYGWSALYRLYDTAAGWLCVAVLDDDAWRALGPALDRPDLVTDPRFATSAARTENDAALASELTEALRRRGAHEWFDVLDAAGVPCEVSDPDYVLRLFADPASEERGLVSAFQHREVGRLRMAGLYFDLSDTPGRIWGPPLWPGAQSRSILAELGYSPDEIDKLVAAQAVGTSEGHPAPASTTTARS